MKGFLRMKLFPGFAVRVLLLLAVHITGPWGHAQGVTTTVAGGGGGISGGFSGDGGPATAALLRSPGAIAADGAGNVFIADSGNHRVRQVTPAGLIDTIAGTGAPDISTGNGPLNTNLWFPNGVAVDTAGNVHIVSPGMNTVITISSTGTVISTGAIWSFSFPYDFIESSIGIATDSQRNFFVAQLNAHQINKITPNGTYSVEAGDGKCGFAGDGGAATAAKVCLPRDVAVDAAGNIYIADSGNRRIRKVNTQGIISTIAGTGTAAFSGDGGPATSAGLLEATSVAVNTAGEVFIADGCRIRRIAPNGVIATVAGNGTCGFGGDGGPPLSATFSPVSDLTLDAAGNILFATPGNHRIRRIYLAPPTITGISSNFAVQGGTAVVTLKGTGFFNPLTINAGDGVTASNIQVLDFNTATATLTVAPNADLGTRALTATTSNGSSNAVALNVATPFPDLSVSISHVGNLGVGFNGTYAIAVRNAGTAPTTSPITLTDVLADGINFVSGTGAGWSCSAAGKIVTCVNGEPLPAGQVTNLALSVAVTSAAAPQIAHSISAQTAGDLVSANDTGADPTTIVASPAPALQIAGSTTLSPGQQETVGVSLPEMFPFDVTGTLTMIFVPDAIAPLDDPAIQFPSGSRQISFVIPANALQARFFGASQLGPTIFQTGTVAGILRLEAVLNAGTEQSTITRLFTISRAAPSIQKVQIDERNGFNILLTLWSTPRDVTQLTLDFRISPRVSLSCGSAPGCVAERSTLTFDVAELFRAWYANDTRFGSLALLRLPLSINGSIDGSVVIRLHNSHGVSNEVAVPLP